MKSTLATLDLPFRPSHEPLDQPGAPPCCYQSTGSVILRRQDNTGYPLPIHDPGHIRTGDGATDSADNDGQVAHFSDLPLGEAHWQWRESVVGEHLIGVDTVSDELRFEPGEILRDPAPVEVIPGGRKITAIHLPPPVMINLREEAPAEQDRLTDNQLAYFQRNGNNALIFIHGYNVEHGQWSRFVKSAQTVTRYQGHGAVVAGKPRWWPEQATVRQDAEALSRQFSLTLDPDDVNGTGAHNWAVNMEYELNRAAGFDGEDWMPYSRIIHLSWPGDTGATDFTQSELNAMAAGRRLVPLLQQLRDSGIAVNLITHSLGARVALTALNILGTIGSENLVDHLFLWEPAVADNALTNDPGRDVHPLAMGVFPAVYRAVRQVVVLHSRGDGILGPQTRGEKNTWVKLLSYTPAGLISEFGREIFRIGSADDPVDEALGLAGGAYNKKWWTFPWFIEDGLAPSIEALYQDYLPLTYDPQPPTRANWHPGNERHKQAVLNNWARLEQDMLKEADALRQPCIDSLNRGQRPPAYRLLAPLNAHASVSQDAARDYIKRLKHLSLRHWMPKDSPRPALGYVGFSEVAGKDAAKFKDDFIQDQLDNGRFQIVDQTDWLFSHSGMKIPSAKLFKNVFQREIMQTRLLANSSFGRYG